MLAKTVKEARRLKSVSPRHIAKALLGRDESSFFMLAYTTI